MAYFSVEMTIVDDDNWILIRYYTNSHAEEVGHITNHESMTMGEKSTTQAKMRGGRVNLYQPNSIGKLFTPIDGFWTLRLGAGAVWKIFLLGLDSLTQHAASIGRNDTKLNLLDATHQSYFFSKLHYVWSSMNSYRGMCRLNLAQNPTKKLSHRPPW